MNRKKLLQNAISWLLIYLSAILVKYRIGNLGYLNLSDAFIITVLADEPIIGLLIAGSASAAGDITLSYGYYSFATFLIKGTEGWLICQGQKRKINTIWTSLLALAVMIIGYGISDVIMFGAAMLKTSLLYNAIQAAAAFAVGSLLRILLDRLSRK